MELGAARSAIARGVNLATVLAVLTLAGSARPAQAAAPGDVYFRVGVDQRFQYYAFPQDVVTWDSTTVSGTSLSFSASHDTLAVANRVIQSSSCNAPNDGTLTADFGSYINAMADRGIFYHLYNTLSVAVYIKYPTGTPYRLRVISDGQIDVSRFGGLPGTIQPVNGTATASFHDSTGTISVTGAASVSVDELRSYAGNSGASIVVGTDTYSYAGTYFLRAAAQVTQTVCVLGCMTAADTLTANGGGHFQIDVYPNQNPTAAPVSAESPRPLALQVAPNPLRESAVVSFEAPRGTPTLIQVFDVRGRLVSRLFDAPATGQSQQVGWGAARLANGLYFVRVQAGREAFTEKVTLLR